MTVTPGLTTTQGQATIAESVTGNGNIDIFFLSLVQGSFTPAFSHHAPSDIGPRPTVPGYNDILIDTNFWSFNAGVGAVTATFDSQTFTFNPYATSPQTVTGWQLWYSTGSSLLWEGLLDTPYLIPAGGGSLVLGPMQVVFEACGAPTPNVVLLDHFVGPNGTNLQAHPPDKGPGYTVLSLGAAGTPSITLQGNHAVPAYAALPNSDGQAAIEDSGASDVTAMIVAVSHTHQHPGVIARYQSASNFWLLELDAETNIFVLYERVAGTFMPRITTPYVPADGESVTITLNCSGPNFLGTLQGAGFRALGWNSTSLQSATICGFRQGSGGGGTTAAEFDLFQVTSP